MFSKIRLILSGQLASWSLVRRVRGIHQPASVLITSHRNSRGFPHQNALVRMTKRESPFASGPFPGPLHLPVDLYISPTADSFCLTQFGLTRSNIYIPLELSANPSVMGVMSP
jgi:hypothetical protein